MHQRRSDSLEMNPGTARCNWPRLLAEACLCSALAITTGVRADVVADTLIDDLAGGDIAFMSGDIDIVGSPGGPTPEQVVEYWSTGFGGPSVSNSATIDQQGDSNVSSLWQAGAGNVVSLEQIGTSNNAAMVQGGTGNGLTLVQQGNGLRISVGQKGVGRSATVIQTN